MKFNLDMYGGAHKSDYAHELARVMESESLINGSELKLFEHDWALYNGVNYAVGVGNGTDALRLALLALGIKSGDEVISPAFNVAYTAQAVEAIGARNVFVDVDPRTLLMDIEKIEEAMTKKVRAIIPVHLYGQMVHMEKLVRYARSLDHPVVIEDAAQAHGATYAGLPPGSFSDAACYSHYPTKNLGCWGEGGSVTTHVPSVADRIKLLRDAGRTDRYVHVLPGINSGLDEIQATVLRTKLSYLNQMNERRRGIARRYIEGLTGVGDLSFQHVDLAAHHVYHLFVVRTAHRNALHRFLKEEGIPSLIHYPLPVHQQPFLANEVIDLQGFPVAEQAAREVLSLPMHPHLTEAEADTVIDAVRKFYDLFF